MNNKLKVIPVSIILAIVLYFLDAVIFYIFNEGNYSFLRSLLADDPISEFYSRVLMVSGVIIFGLFVSGKINEMFFKSEHSVARSRKKESSNLDFRFLSSLSFQLRTPLNAIIGFSELLKKPHLTPDSKEIYINHINSSSKYLLLLVNNLSEISKIESNEFKITREETNINAVIEELFHIYTIRKVEMGRSNIPLLIEKVKLKENLTILTDADRLRHVLNILLENAFVQTEEGIVKLGYSLLKSGYIEFFVTDTGQGISQERLENIFDRYNKLTDNSNLPFDGIALRLAISKSLVKILGGEIRAETNPGQGVSIYFTIPYIESAKTQTSPVEKKLEPASSRDWTNRVVLIAEDVESNFLYLEELLRPTHIKIIWAKNGMEAVNMAKNNPKIELVLMDILMPVMDGYQAAREIRALRNDLPIVAQTAYTIDDSSKSDNARNFNSFLIKPIWAPQLLSTIEKYIV